MEKKLSWKSGEVGGSRGKSGEVGGVVVVAMTVTVDVKAQFGRRNQQPRLQFGSEKRLRWVGQLLVVDLKFVD